MHSTVGLGGLAFASATVNCIMLLWFDRRILHENQQRQAKTINIDCGTDATTLVPIAPDTPFKMTWISKYVTVVGGILLAHA